MSPISGIASIQIPQTIAPLSQAGQAGSSSFGDMLSGAIQSLEGLKNNANSAVQSFLTGQNEELHSTILATQKAQMAFELGVQVRNKVVDAYQEVMKMQM